MAAIGAGTLLIGSLSAVLGLGWANPASANHGTAHENNGAQTPAGNNGTIKINEIDVDSGPSNANDPHVECTFVVKFFGYDAGVRNAVLTFEPQPPTGDGTTTTFNRSFTVLTRTGGDQLNYTTEPIDLSTSSFAGVEPHQNQGFHVKLTVNVDGAQGADVKHKVFWIEPCEEPEVEDTTTTTSTSTTRFKPLSVVLPSVLTQFVLLREYFFPGNLRMICIAYSESDKKWRFVVFFGRTREGLGAAAIIGAAITGGSNAEDRFEDRSQAGGGHRRRNAFDRQPFSCAGARMG